MVDKPGRSTTGHMAINAINGPDKLPRQSKAAKSSQPKKSPIEPELVDQIIAQIKAQQGPLTPQAVQKKIVLKTLTANFGLAAVQETRFNAMFTAINQALSQNKAAQALIVDAIKRYGDNKSLR